MATSNPLVQLHQLGQSIWLDDIGKKMLADGSLAKLIKDDAVAGVTSNPAILAHSITSDPLYAQAIKDLLPKVSGSMALYEALAIDDLQRAADLFRPLYDSVQGKDGFVSLEVSPHLAYDTAGSVQEGRRLHGQLNRENAFIKIPGTEPGIGAIRQLITDGINVNVTLLFSPERYRAVALAYIDGLEARVAAKKPVDRVASVASFFLSRIDSNVDPKLDAADCIRTGGRKVVARRGGDCERCARLPDLRRTDCLPPLAGIGKGRGTAAAASVGLDLNQGQDLQPDQVRGRADRPRDREHGSPGDDQRLSAKRPAAVEPETAPGGLEPDSRRTQQARHRPG